MSVGKQLLSSILSTGTVKDFVSMGLDKSLFKDNEALLYDFIRDHIGKFGKLPAIDTIEAEIGDVLVPFSETPEYYLEKVERRFTHNSLKSLTLGMQEFLKNEDSDAAFELLMERSAEMHMKKHRKDLWDFRFAKSKIHNQYKAQTLGLDGAVSFGWQTLDKESGGLIPGDFAAVVGRPAAGKTFLGLYMAMYNWHFREATPIFASMEMRNIIIAQRLAAMEAKKNLGQLMKAMMSTKAYTALMDSLSNAAKAPNPFWLLDGNLASDVPDLIQYCRQLKPSVLLIDGAYLLRHPNPRAGKFDKITDNAEALKQKVATDLGIPVVASYQLNREAAKKNTKGKNQESAGLEDIYGTDAIGQLATIVLGLQQDESVETMTGRSVDIMKGRNGEVGRFNINWDFQNMDFSEKVEEDPEDLQFL